MKNITICSFGHDTYSIFLPTFLFYYILSFVTMTASCFVFWATKNASQHTSAVHYFFIQIVSAFSIVREIVNLSLITLRFGLSISFKHQVLNKLMIIEALQSACNISFIWILALHTALATLFIKENFTKIYDRLFAHIMIIGSLFLFLLSLSIQPAIFLPKRFDECRPTDSSVHHHYLGIVTIHRKSSITSFLLNTLAVAIPTILKLAFAVYLYKLISKDKDEYVKRLITNTRAILMMHLLPAITVLIFIPTTYLGEFLTFYLSLTDDDKLYTNQFHMVSLLGSIGFTIMTLTCLTFFSKDEEFSKFLMIRLLYPVYVHVIHSPCIDLGLNSLRHIVVLFKI